MTSVPLRFPGNGMTVNVPVGTRLEMFPQGNFAAYENVEFYIGIPAVCFVVKRTIIEAQPRSFLAEQLSHSKTAQKGADGTKCLSVTLDAHNPLMFPLLFGYINQIHTDPSVATLPTFGLSMDETKTITELADGVMRIESSLTGLLFKAKRPLTDTPNIQFDYKGRLAITPERLVHAETTQISVSEDGKISLTDGADGSLTIDLRKIPTEKPWPYSLVEDKIIDSRLKARQIARDHATPVDARSKERKTNLKNTEPPLGDPLPPMPTTDDDILHTPAYPYPVDHAHVFFIPATAIVCTVGETRVICEGMYDCEENKIRIDAVDQEAHNMLWAEIYVLQ